jgi:hypothetical protein
LYYGKDANMKSRPSLLTMLLATCILCINCKKQDRSYVVEINLLTQDTLVYDEQILWWNSPNQTISYKRDSIFNSNDLKGDWFKYERDGSFEAALSNGHTYSGNWELLENATKIRLSSIELSYDETFEIIALTKEKFEWTDLEHHSFYRQVSKK